MLIVLFSLLLPASACSVYIRIASLKYNTHLGVDGSNNLVVVSDLKSANTTWLLSGPYISLPDGATFLGVTNDAPVLSTSLKEEWTYDRNSMKIGMESRSGYLMMSATTVYLVDKNPDLYNMMIMYPVPQSKGKQIAQTMKERLDQADEQQHKLTLAMNGQYAVTDKFLARVEAFKIVVQGNLTVAKAKTDEVKAMTSQILGHVAKLIAEQHGTIKYAKTTINATREERLPELKRRWGNLQYVPDALLGNAKHKKEQLLAHIDKATTEFNQSVTDLIDKHRILPQGSYDWIVITVMICYVIYFVDVFLRVSKPKIGKPKTNLTMEMEQQDLETSVISPEHFLTDDSLPRTFDSKAVKIQGELKFHPR